VVKQYCGEDINTISPTLGFNIKTLEFKNYRLNVWDVGGQQTIRSYWRNYFEQTDGLVWVIDATDSRRVLDSAKELHALLKEERLAGASLLVLANKRDLPGAMSVEAVQELLQLDAIKSRHWRIESCSAVKGWGLREGVEWLVNDIASRIFMLE
jgi:ADP-ribosylation factor-like protein 2